MLPPASAHPYSLVKFLLNWREWIETEVQIVMVFWIVFYFKNKCPCFIYLYLWISEEVNLGFVCILPQNLILVFHGGSTGVHSFMCGNSCLTHAAHPDSAPFTQRLQLENRAEVVDVQTCGCERTGLVTDSGCWRYIWVGNVHFEYTWRGYVFVHVFWSHS